MVVAQVVHNPAAAKVVAAVAGMAAAVDMAGAVALPVLDTEGSHQDMVLVVAVAAQHMASPVVPDNLTVPVPDSLNLALVPGIHHHRLLDLDNHCRLPGPGIRCRLPVMDIRLRHLEVMDNRRLLLPVVLSTPVSFLLSLRRQVCLLFLSA